MSPYTVTRDFEQQLCFYTGARYAVAVNSGTAALLLCLLWWKRSNPALVGLPRRTYVSVACAAKQAGYEITWRDEHWQGMYQLQGTQIYDSARRFTSGMYFAGSYLCVSFSTSKILGAEQGGAILHDDAAADSWFRKMRFDGRTEGIDPRVDTFDVVGHHCIMLPSTAAELILKLHHLPRDNADLPYHEYPDLSQHAAFA